MRHDWLVTGFHVGFLVVAVVFAAYAQGLAKRTVRGHTTKPKTTWPKRGCLVVLFLASLLFVIVVSDGALHFDWKQIGLEAINKHGAVKFYRSFVPEALPYILASANADVSEKEVSSKPQDWFRIDPKERIDSTLGAQLAGLNLRGLLAGGAFLAKADLRDANLREADLRGADLQEANLEYANLQKAYLGKTLF